MHILFFFFLCSIEWACYIGVIESCNRANEFHLIAKCLNINNMCAVDFLYYIVQFFIIRFMAQENNNLCGCALVLYKNNALCICRNGLICRTRRVVTQNLCIVFLWVVISLLSSNGPTTNSNETG